MVSFRIALATGIVAILGLIVTGLYPVALLVSAVVMPLLTLLYFIDVNIYESEPARVLAVTLAWGVVAGIGMGWLSRSLTPDGALVLGASRGSRIATWGLLIPLLSTVLGLAGPLLLLPYRHFNDVLDGATFGAASGITLVATRVVIEAWPQIGAGLRPVGASSVWLAEVLRVGIGGPLVAAGASGAVAGALWLRYRRPVRNREELGPLGHPLVAGLAAAVLVVVAGSAPVLLGAWSALVLTAVCALVGLTWLRTVIHVGLLEEAGEREVGPDMLCPNCLQATPVDTFCISCGIALRALPKQRYPRDGAEAAGQRDSR